MSSLAGSIFTNYEGKPQPSHSDSLISDPVPAHHCQKLMLIFSGHRLNATLEQTAIPNTPQRGETHFHNQSQKKQQDPSLNCKNPPINCAGPDSSCSQEASNPASSRGSPEDCPMHLPTTDRIANQRTIRANNNLSQKHVHHEKPNDQYIRSLRS